MGIRDIVNKYQRASSVTVAAIMLAAGWYGVRSLSTHGDQVPLPTNYYFTIDDGQTFFPETADHIPPFEHAGKMAVQAHLFSRDGGKTTFLAYLEKFDDAFVKKAATRMSANSGPAYSINSTAEATFARRVKKPGLPEWFAATSAKGNDVMTIHPPGGGSTDDLAEVFP